MAARKTNWGGAVVAAVIIVVAFWYILTHKKRAAGSGGGGAVGAGGAGPLNSLLPKPSSGSGGGLSGGGGFGGGSGASPNLSGALKNWINGVLNQGYRNAAGLSLSPTDYIPGLGETPGLSIPSVAVPGFGDLNDFLVTSEIPGYDGSGDPGLLEETDLTDQSISSFGYGGFSPNDFLVTSDIPQTADLSSYGIDSYYGSDQVQTDETSYLDSESGGYSSSGYEDPLNAYLSPSGNGANDGY